MESQEKVKLPVLKKDAKINIVIGTQMVQALQGLTFWLMKEHQEDGKQLQSKLENKQPLEIWEQAVVTLSQFLKAVGEQAEKDGSIYYKDVEDIIK